MNMHVSLVAERSQANEHRWAETLNARQVAKQVFEEFQEGVWNHLAEELERISPRPDLSFEVRAARGEVARYLVPANDLHAWDNHWSRLIRDKAAVVREAWLAHRRACERLGWDAACEEGERLCSIQTALESALILMPAPNSSALLWKLEYLFGSPARSEDEYCDSWCADWMNQVMSDIRRLLGRADDRSTSCRRRAVST
jgi:hypothetical protein